MDFQRQASARDRAERAGFNVYPADVIDLQRMNRVLRHRLRNLCAGLKLTTESIRHASGGDRGLEQKCLMMLEEIAAVHRMTDRMDWLFDVLPPPLRGTWRELVEGAAAEFCARHPLSTLNLDGPGEEHELEAGNWLGMVLSELLANAGEAAGKAGDVSLMWSFEGGLCFTVVNAGSLWPESVVIDPPSPFVTTRGQHLGIGLCIVHRVCLALGLSMDVSMPAPDVVAVRMRGNREAP